MFYDISKINGIDICVDEINDMSYSNRRKFLNENPVIVARNFQYQVKLFFKVIVLDDPLRERYYYATRLEFQVRGSTHVYFYI